MPESEPQQPAEITFRTGYAGMIAAFRARAHERRIAIAGDSVAAVSGLPSAYIAKLLSPNNPVRRIGMIFFGATSWGSPSEASAGARSRSGKTLRQSDSATAGVLRAPYARRKVRSRRAYTYTAAVAATNGAPRRRCAQCRVVAKAAQSTRTQGRECAMAESCGGEKGGGQSGKAQGGVMANVTECIEKLATGGQITRKVADEALEFFNPTSACDPSR